MKANSAQILAVALVACALLGAYTYKHHARPVTQALESAVEVRTKPRDPVHIRIVRLGIDAPVEVVGRTADGAMGVPKGPVNAAWYNLGPRPGEVGSAVIDGHSGWKDGIPAVFDKLTNIKVGDEISVVDTKGRVSTFVVQRKRPYTEDESAADVFTSTDGKAHLNLITCEGVWNPATQDYSERLVVFADLK